MPQKYDYSEDACGFVFKVARTCYTYLKKSQEHFKKYRPRDRKLPLFEFLVYLFFLLDVANCTAKLSDNSRQDVFRRIFNRIGVEFRKQSVGNLLDCFDGRMSQYTEIWQKHYKNDLWLELIEYLGMLLTRAEIEKKIFRGRLGEFPVVLDATKGFTIKNILLEIHERYIFPFRRVCYEMLGLIQDKE